MVEWRLGRIYLVFGLLLIGLAGLIMTGITGCEGIDEELSPPDITTPTATPQAASNAVRYYLYAQSDGLYCQGHFQPDTQSDVIYVTPQRWMPWPMNTGDSFESYINGDPTVFTVSSTDQTVSTPAGSFDGVISFHAEGYGWAVMNFKPGVGLVQKQIGAGRGYTTFTLRVRSVSQGQTDAETRFALAVGNVWEYTLSGFSTNGEALTGTASDRIVGKRSISNRETFVLERIAVVRYSDSGKEVETNIQSPAFHRDRFEKIIRKKSEGRGE